MSQGVLCPNLTKKFQSKVSQMADHKLPCGVAIGGLSVNLNHLKRCKMSDFECLHDTVKLI